MWSCSICTARTTITPMAESAGELKRLMDEGKDASVGVSNFSLAQLQEFAADCPLAAFQPPYNMLQREIEADTLPWCREHDVAVMVYWPLMKGLLAGKLARDHMFPPATAGRSIGCSTATSGRRTTTCSTSSARSPPKPATRSPQLVINWTIHQPGITAALCGAKRPDQIRENAGGMGWRLTPDQLARIDAALKRTRQATNRCGRCEKWMVPGRPFYETLFSDRRFWESIALGSGCKGVATTSPR